MPAAPLRGFLEIPYDRLEELNLEAKKMRLDRVDPDKAREQRERYLAGQEWHGWR